jgi:hypothetical protein
VGKEYEKEEVLTSVPKVITPKFYTWNVTEFDASFPITTSCPSTKINKHLHVFREILQDQQILHAYVYLLLPTPILLHYQWRWWLQLTRM